MKFGKIKIFLSVLIIILALITVYITAELYLYYDYQSKNSAMIDFCYNNCKSSTNINKTGNNNQELQEICQNDNKKVENCFARLRELLLPHLLIYKGYIDNKPLEFIHFDIDTSYKVPVQIINLSDVLIGYGVGPSCNFENQFAKMFKKPAFAFDCGNTAEDSKCKEAKFEDECIVTDKFLIKNQVSSDKIHSYGEKLKQMHLENKKIYLKMDIAGAEKDAIPDILKYSDNITAISLVIHQESSKEIIDSIKMLKLLNKDFVIVTRSIIIMPKTKNILSTSRYSTGYDLEKYIVLTLVNKKLLSRYHLKFNQTSKSNYTDYTTNKPDYLTYEPYSNISWQVVLWEKIRKIFKVSYE